MIPIASATRSFIALADPLYIQQLDDLKRTLQWEGMETVLAPQNEIFVAINAAYEMLTGGSKIMVVFILRYWSIASVPLLF